MSNPVVEIVARAQADYYGFRSKRHDEVALAIIAALEKEEYRLVAKEPSAHMLDLALLLWVKPEEAGTLWSDIFDAAPRYGEPSGL